LRASAVPTVLAIRVRPAIMIPPSVGVAISIPVAFLGLHALLEALETFQDLVEFLVEVPRLQNFPPGAPRLRVGGNADRQDGEGCDSQHCKTLNPVCGHGFRGLAGFFIIRLVKRIDHLGVAVSDLAAARKIWDLVTGQEPDCETVATQKVETAMYPCGIELVAPVSEDSPISKFLAKRGDGVHHVTFEVDDIEAHLARLKDAGVRLINETPTPGHGGCRVAFLHPSSTGGVLVELKENS
jgi:methylmalonyl-CoA/ethylmalonyl-CoA epimerase